MQKSIQYLFVFSIILLSYSCDSTNPTPPIIDPPGYQEDISWPSIADSPWPMEGADPQNTFRARIPVQLIGDSIIQSGLVWTESAITVGEDSTIYFPVNPTGNCQLTAMGLDGNIKWLSNIGSECYHPPIVLNDGSLVLLSLTSVIKYDKSGNELWHYTLPEPAGDSELNITKEGDLIFTISGNKIISLNQNGNLNWEFDVIEQLFWKGELVLSPDSKTAYLTGNGLTSFNIVDQKINWTSKIETLTEAASVLSGGSIIFLTSSQQGSSLVKLKSTGDQVWEYKFENTGAEKISIDRNGNIYFCTNDLSSINSDGTLNWNLKGVGNTNPPLCSYENNIHTIINGKDFFSVVSIDYDGNIFTQIDHDYNNFTYANPGAITYGGIVFSGWGSSSVFILNTGSINLRQ